MDEQLVGGLVCMVVSVPAFILGARYRGGHNLETISGYNPDRVRDKQGFGRFMGFWMLVMGGMVLAMGIAIALIPERAAHWTTLAFVAAMQLPILRMLLGRSRFSR
jgi:hypothetical protein